MTRLLDIDTFVAELWKVHLAVAKEGYAQVGCTDKTELEAF
jgi:hypothetical protein